MRSPMTGLAGIFVLVGPLMGPGPLAQSRQTPSDPHPLLATAATYLDHYAKAFAAVTSEETYDLSAFRPRRNGSNYVELRSDLVLIAAGDDWVQVRDVYEVNRKPVRDHVQRLQALLATPMTGGTDLHQIIAESARFNPGHIERNINTPTLALSYLDRASQAHSTFALEGRATVAGVAADILSFKEIAHPTRIRSNGTDTVTSGRFWVDPATGAVLKTELDCVADASSTTARITVRYDRPPGLDLWAPVHMAESYVEPDETDVGDATYSDFKQFVVDTKTLLGRGGGGRDAPRR